MYIIEILNFKVICDQCMKKFTFKFALYLAIRVDVSFVKLLSTGTLNLQCFGAGADSRGAESTNCGSGSS
jgi:hypothetical protein